MVTLPDTTFTSSMPLSEVLVVMTKAEMLSRPLAILCTLCKNELQLAKDFVDAGPNAYLTRKMRKTFYKLQKYGLVLTYEDWEKHEWRMLMPDCVREVLSANLPGLLTLVEKIGRVPSYKELRMMIMLDSFMHSAE